MAASCLNMPTLAYVMPEAPYVLDHEASTLSKYCSPFHEPNLANHHRRSNLKANVQSEANMY
jgi:hypothetical protein